MKKYHLLIPALLTSALLTACGGDGKKADTMIASSSMSSKALSSMPASSSMASSALSMMPVKFSITITNLTAGQPLSPTALVLHKPSLKLFQVGMPASVELEKIAEGGSPTALLEDANNNTATFITGRPAMGIVPGTSATVVLETSVASADAGHLSLSALSMLGNTNDGFTGLNSVDLSKLAVGASLSLDTISYDAGTELNSETAATVPGPAAKGEGFNPMRDDTLSVVAMHSGIISKDDGLPTSALSNLQRWDNPVARISITRMAP